MIVVAIIGILAAVALPKFAGLIERARETSTQGAMSTIRSAISLYYADTEGVYPAVIEPTPGQSISKYLEAIPPVKATHAGIGNGITESPSGLGVLYTTDEGISASGTG